ncbi:MAG: hypothetical protein BIFFINMI_00267 [Phycisphaerae bacterium]|nr:hypothetical protein [Phycisphaerae bacterium]
MLRTGLVLTAAALLAASLMATSSLHAAVILSDTFDAANQTAGPPPGWTIQSGDTNIYENGGVLKVVTSTGTGKFTKTLYNDTTIPLGVTITVDIIPVSLGSGGHGMGILFGQKDNSTSASASNAAHGYLAVFKTGGISTDPCQLVLYADDFSSAYRGDGNTADDALATVSTFANNDLASGHNHTLKVSDDGLGHIKVYLDDTLYIDFDDSANYYPAANGNYTTAYVGLAVGTGSAAAGNFDNFLVEVEAVPEPATMTLLALGGVGLIGAGIRRRRSA